MRRVERLSWVGPNGELETRNLAVARCCPQCQTTARVVLGPATMAWSSRPGRSPHLGEVSCPVCDLPIRLGPGGIVRDHAGADRRLCGGSRRVRYVEPRSPRDLDVEWVRPTYTPVRCGLCERCYALPEPTFASGLGPDTPGAAWPAVVPPRPRLLARVWAWLTRPQGMA